MFSHTRTALLQSWKVIEPKPQSDTAPVWAGGTPLLQPTNIKNAVVTLGQYGYEITASGGMTGVAFNGTAGGGVQLFGPMLETELDSSAIALSIPRSGLKIVGVELRLSLSALFSLRLYGYSKRGWSSATVWQANFWGGDVVENQLEESTGYLSWSGTGGQYFDYAGASTPVSTGSKFGLVYDQSTHRFGCVTESGVAWGALLSSPGHDSAYPEITRQAPAAQIVALAAGSAGQQIASLCLLSAGFTLPFPAGTVGINELE